MQTTTPLLVVWCLTLTLGTSAGCGLFGGGAKSAGGETPGELDVIARNDDGSLLVGVSHLGVQFEVPRGTNLAPDEKEPGAIVYAFADSKDTYFQIDRDASRYFDSALDYVDKQRMKQDGFEEGAHEDVANGWDADYAFQAAFGRNHDYFGQFEVGSVIYRCQLWGKVSEAQLAVGRTMCRSLAALGESKEDAAEEDTAKEGGESQTTGCLTPDDCGEGEQCCAGMNTRCVPDGECNGGDTPLLACSTMADCPELQYGMKVRRCGPSPSGTPGLKVCLID